MSIEPGTEEYYRVRREHNQMVNSNAGDGEAQRAVRSMGSGKWAGGKGDRSRVDPAAYRAGMEALRNSDGPRESEPPCDALIAEWQRQYSKKIREITLIEEDLEDSRAALLEWIEGKAQYLNFQEGS